MKNYLMSNRSNLSFMGLDIRSVRVIKNIIELVDDLSSNFNVVDDYTTSHIDILMVNFDDPNTVDVYMDYKKQAQNNLKVVRCGNNVEDTSMASLKLPLTRVSLESTLREAVSTNAIPTKTESKTTTSTSDGGLNQHHTLSVLVVDDSFPVRQYLSDKLPKLVSKIDSRHNINMAFASSGRDAVDKIKTAKGQYDLILLDVIMDDVDGYKICKWIKSVKKSITVVMLTSKSSPFDKVRGRLAGCDAYLSKPPLDKELQKILVGCLDK